MFLEDIIGNVQLETDNVECKGILNREDVVGWLKSVAGFANMHGGVLYVGVKDKTNQLIGFDRKEADNERTYFNNQVNEHLVPRPQMKISFLRYEVKGKERFIIQIKIEESAIKPIILKYQGMPLIYMRRDGFTNGATYEEIIDMCIQSKNIQYDIMPSNVIYDSHKISILKDFYSKHNNGKELSEKVLRSLGFMDENNYLANGAVLFLDDYNEKKTEVQCSVFAGFTKGSERIVTINRFNANIISSIQYMVDFVEQRMNHSVIKKNDARINIDAYPSRSLFEGIINAVAHRDYYIDGAQIQIDLFKDRLEISSPGGFYKGEKIGKTYDLSGIISKRRNELIAGILVACNVMEAAGTGFEKIMEEYANADEKHKPFIYSSSDHFTLVLPDLTFIEGTQDDMTPHISFLPVQNGTALDELVLSYCFWKERKVSDIANHLGISDSTYLRKQVLENLEKNGYLIKRKVSRASYFKTNPEMVYLD